MSTAHKYLSRLAALRRSMEESNVQAVFLAPSGDMEYITGLRRRPPDPTEATFTGDDLLGVLVTQSQILTFLPPSAAIHGVEGLLVRCPWLCKQIVRLPQGIDQPEEGYRKFGELGLASATVAFPRRAQAMTVINLSRYYPHMTFVNAEPLTAPLRMHRDEDDLSCIKEAARITDRVFRQIVAYLQPGITESEVIREIERLMVEYGAEGPSFRTMLLSGRPGSGPLNFPMPAGSAPGSKGRVLEKGDVLAFDFGVLYGGWCSDFGRTVYFGEPTTKMAADHHLVADAQRAALESMVAGRTTAEETDAAARGVFAGAGRAHEFTHGLGHGVGVDIHERPSLSSGDRTILEAGMTVAVEPSLWVDREYFVRDEDVVVVTDGGGVSLHESSPYDILVIE